MNANLRSLLHALFLELERLDWEDFNAIELGPVECDSSFDYGDGEHPGSEIDDDLPDETDFANWPLCVECGNFTPSCTC